MARRTPWDRIPVADIDFNKPIDAISKQYQDAYFEVQLFAISEVSRAEHWRLLAINLPILILFIGFCAGVGVSLP